jgi:hypothetical protein
MNDLVVVFRMSELSAASRIRVIKELGKLINHEYASNITEPLVYELVIALDPNDTIKDDPHYKSMLDL